MSKALIITEKPSVARDIADALGGFEAKGKGGEYYESDDYLCTYAVGHILTLFSPEDIKPEYRRWRLADLPIIPESFNLKPMDNQKGRIKVIKRLMQRKDVDRLINACDAAREGELIFREIVQFLESQKPVQRLWLQSMTKSAIHEGFASLSSGSDHDGLGAAAACRAQADWLIGMNATRALTVRLKSRNQRGVSWSAGRVQTPTLSLLVNRELEILEYQPLAYDRIKGLFKTPDHAYESYYYDPNFKPPGEDKRQREYKEDRIFDPKKTAEILAAVKSGTPATASETRKPSNRKAPALFDLTTLQKTANSRFGWSASRTLKAAQRCYESHKMLTYPRTSSRVLPENYKGEVDRIISQLGKTIYQPFAVYLYKNGRLNEKTIFNDKKVTDHFAIIPTGEFKELSGDDARIYDLVVRQFLAAFYPPSVYEDVERLTEVGGYHFKIKPPKVLKEAGWETVFDRKPSEEETFPPLVAGQDKVEGVAVETSGSQSESLETKPPSRISEAGLLSLMENAGRHVEDEDLASVLKESEGLGTAATRADIIENLKNREYVDNNLRPTVKGIRLVDILHRIGASRLTSAELTAQLEKHLAEVEEGQRTAQEFIEEIRQYTCEVVEATRDFKYEGIYPDENPVGPCPVCQLPVYERAWFYGCEEAARQGSNKKCSLLMWKDNNGRYINRAVVRQIIEKGETEELSGFRSPGGQSYSAQLVLENGQIVRRATGGSGGEGEGFEVNEEPLGECLKHDQCKVIETPNEFICQTKKQAREDGDHHSQGVMIPRMLCKREITREEALVFLEKKETDMLAGFISKRGRKFRAKLKYDDTTGGFNFEFPAWGSGKKTKSTEAKAAADQEAQPKES